MAKGQLLSFDFFQSIHEKDAYFEKITNPKIVKQKLLNHLVWLILFSFIHGVVMGCYNGFLQAFFSGVKVPILFVLIILICFPALYVIQTILGSRLTLSQMLSIIMSGLVMTTTILVSFSPIVLFFLITGGSYAFIQLLNVAIFTLAGLFGMHSIIQALKFSCDKKNVYPKVGVQVLDFHSGICWRATIVEPAAFHRIGRFAVPTVPQTGRQFLPVSRNFHV